MSSEQLFRENLTAELAALNIAVMRALSSLATLAEREGPDGRRKYLSAILDSGMRDIAKTEYSGVAPERREILIEKARARYTDIITGIRGPEG